MMFYVLFSLIVCCGGFLLEGQTQLPPTSAPVMSDKHYNMLMDLLIEERQYRRQLEQDMTKLKQDLLTTEREVTNKYQIWTKYNGTIEKQYLNLSNSTTNLQSKFVLLEAKYDKLNREHTDLQQNHTVLEAHATEIEHKLSRLEQIKSFSNMQSVLNVINETKHLESEIQKTNTRVDRVVSEADARKQDFLALFNKVLSTDERLDNNSLSQQTKWNDLSSKFNQIEASTNKKLNNTWNDLTKRVNKNEASTNEKLNNITVSFYNKWNDLSNREIKAENTTTQIQKKLNAATNRVAMTACRHNDVTLNSGLVIPFQTMLRSYGIQDKSSFTTTGIFTCEQEGLYLVTVNLVEHGSGEYFNVFLNGSIIRKCFASRETEWQESACTTFIQLNVHDKISVKTGSRITVSGVYSCVTVIKIM